MVIIRVLFEFFSKGKKIIHDGDFFIRRHFFIDFILNSLRVHSLIIQQAA